MPALPTLSRTYASRRDVPLPDSSTAAAIRQSRIWLFKAFLMNQVSTGTLSGTRHANSEWTMYYSCDSTTAGTPGDGVDRWPSHTNVISASAGTAHSWAVMYNANAGLYVTLDANSTAANLRVSHAYAAPTGGTTTQGPTSTQSWLAGSTSSDNAAAGGATFVNDTTVAATHYAHFTTTDTGEYYYLSSRTGQGLFSHINCLLRSTGAHVTDTYNFFTAQVSSTSGRGAPVAGVLIGASGFTGRTPDGGVAVTSGGAQSNNFGGTAWAGSNGVDALTGNYPGFPIFIATFTAPVAYRGQLQDTYFCATAPVGASVPTVAAQEYIVCGDLFIPFVGGPPSS